MEIENINEISGMKTHSNCRNDGKIEKQKGIRKKLNELQNVPKIRVVRIKGDVGKPWKMEKHASDQRFQTTKKVRKVQDGHTVKSSKMLQKCQKMQHEKNGSKKNKFRITALKNLQRCT